MTDTLPDLRTTIAESMEALAFAMPGQTDDGRFVVDENEAWRLMHGAETLRWCAEREAPSYDELEAELDAALEAQEEAEGNRDDLVDNVKYAVSKWLHGETCAVVLAAPDVECSCGMAKMRQSVLDAVA